MNKRLLILSVLLGGGGLAWLIRWNNVGQVCLPVAKGEVGERHFGQLRQHRLLSYWA